MTYIPLQVGVHLSPALRDHVIGNIVEPFFREFHILVQAFDPQQGPKGSMQRSLAVLILSAIDGAAQLFCPDKGLGDGDRFRRYVERNFPWELDRPNGFTIEEAAEMLWTDTRCPILHRFGAHGGSVWLKYAKRFTIDEQRVEDFESVLDQAPGSEPMVSRNEVRTAVYVDSLYWALRISIIRALDTAEKCKAVEDHLESGEWARKTKKTVIMPTPSDSTVGPSVAIRTEPHS